MDIFTDTNNHATKFKFTQPLHLLIGLRHPRSLKCAADGAFVIAQETPDSPIHTCVFVDGVRFTSTTTLEKVLARIEFLQINRWEFLSETDIGLVCFGMSHVQNRDIFWKSEYKP